jgi:hypothetical protein
MFIDHSIRNRSFDSTLLNAPMLLEAGTTPGTTNFSLTLYLRVHLHQRNPRSGNTFKVRDADNNRIDCVRWTAEAWTTFTQKYLEQVNSFWDNTFILETPSAVTCLDHPETGANRRRRNVDCHFRLTLEATALRAHASIPVVCLAPNVTFFRSHALLYDNRDLEPMEFQSQSGRVSWQFFTFSHEVGHLLGLGHSNENSAACRANPDSEVCYGGGPQPVLSLQLDAMGTGSMLSLEYARPWQNRIVQHVRQIPPRTTTRAGDWTPQWMSADAAFRGAESVQLH